jgi:hypothetical protein
MSIFRVTKHDVDTLTVVTNPTRAFTSSSRNGVTGSVYVYPRRSHIEKEVEPVSSFVDSVKNDSDINVSLSAVQALGLSARNGSTNAQATFSGSLAQYMTKVNAQQSSVRKKKVLNVSRFIPSYQFTKDTLKKTVRQRRVEREVPKSVPVGTLGLHELQHSQFFYGFDGADIVGFVVP